MGFLLSVFSSALFVNHCFKDKTKITYLLFYLAVHPAIPVRKIIYKSDRHNLKYNIGAVRSLIISLLVSKCVNQLLVTCHAGTDVWFLN